MAPKRKTGTTEDSERRKKGSITIEDKKEIIEKYKKGVRVSQLACEYGRSTSTICTILKKREEIKKLDVAKGVKTMYSTKQRPKLLEDVEKLLMLWINDKQLAGDSISEPIICAKAKALYLDLVKKTPGTTSEDEDAFKASRGWFENFRKRTGIHSVARHGEAASSDTAAAEKYVAEFKNFVSTEAFLPQQVFNCDETGLFWKKMPKRTYITKEEKSLPGHKPMKDRLTLLLCANASGDLKVKPMLVYHSENPRVFKKFNVQKNRLNVMWRANSKAWVTQQFFIEWVNKVFGPSVKKYLKENNLPLKALLVLDNAPAHPSGLEDTLMKEFQFIKIEFLPPNTTPLLQPLDQQVIANFKKLYTKALFQKCFDITENTQLTLREFWKDHFNILSCLNLIDQAWQGITVRTLNSAWRKLWPDCIQDRDFEGFQAENVESEVHVIDEIVSLGKNLGLDVDGEDLEELVEEHTQELTTDELIQLHKEQQREVIEELSSGEEEVKKDTIPSSEIKKALKNWEELQDFIEKHHPNKEVSGRAINLFNQNALLHFRDMLKRREKQASLDRFLVKLPKRQQSDSEPQPGPSGVKFRKIRRDESSSDSEDSLSPQ